MTMMMTIMMMTIMMMMMMMMMMMILNLKPQTKHGACRQWERSGPLWASACFCRSAWVHDFLPYLDLVCRLF